MKETKYRAWDKRNNSMIDFDLDNIDMFRLVITKDDWWIEFDNHEDDKQFLDKSYFILLEYTGRNDRNNKKLFQGDIVSIYGKELSIGLIWWQTSTCQFVIDWSFGNKKDFSHKLQHSRELIKIGNEYENPELLEKF